MIDTKRYKRLIAVTARRSGSSYIIRLIDDILKENNNNIVFLNEAFRKQQNDFLLENNKITVLTTLNGNVDLDQRLKDRMEIIENAKEFTVFKVFKTHLDKMDDDLLQRYYDLLQDESTYKILSYREDIEDQYFSSLMKYFKKHDVLDKQEELIKKHKNLFIKQARVIFNEISEQIKLSKIVKFNKIIKYEDLSGKVIEDAKTLFGVDTNMENRTSKLYTKEEKYKLIHNIEFHRGILKEMSESYDIPLMLNITQ